MKTLRGVAFALLAFAPTAHAFTAVLERNPAPQEMAILAVNGGNTAYDEQVDVSMSGNRIQVVYKPLDNPFDIPPPAGGYTYRTQLAKLPAGDYQVDVMTRIGTSTALVTSIPFQVAASRAVVQPIEDHTDLWWNPQESGWGLNLVQHGAGPIFATWFVYGADGNPQWYVIPGGQWVSPIQFSGSIYRTSGPDIAGSFDPTKVTRTVVGSATLTFTGGKLQASLTVDGQTTNKTLQRQSF